MGGDWSVSLVGFAFSRDLLLGEEEGVHSQPAALVSEKEAVVGVAEKGALQWHSLCWPNTLVLVLPLVLLTESCFHY